MQGFIVEEDGSWTKPEPITETVSLKKKLGSGVGGNYTHLNGGSTAKKLPMFKKLTDQNATPGLTDTSASNTDEENENGGMKRKLVETKLTYFSESDNDDDDEGDEDVEEYINEDELIQDLKNDNLIIPKKCELPNGKRRRKACKDCTCGLKELEELEDSKQQTLQNSILGKMAQSASLEAEKIEARLKQNKEKRLNSKRRILLKLILLSRVKLVVVDLVLWVMLLDVMDVLIWVCLLFKPGQAITLDGMDEDI